MAKECSRNGELQWLLGELCPNYHTIAEFRKMNPMSLKNCFKHFVLFLKEAGTKEKAEGKHSMSVLNAIKNKIILSAAAVNNNQLAYQEKHPYESQTFRKKYLENA